MNGSVAANPQYWSRGCAAIIGLLSVSEACVAQCLEYALQISRPPCLGWVLQPRALNEAGDVSGSFSCGGNDHACAIWSANSNVASLNLGPNVVWSNASAISNDGKVAGTYEVAGIGIRGYVYENGATTTLNVLPNHDTGSAYAVSEMSPPIIVGYSANTIIGPTAAVCWQRGNVVPLSLPIGPNSSASGVNSQGQICGWMGGSVFDRHAFLWSRGRTTDLGAIPGGSTSSASAINNLSQVCGSGVMRDPSGSGTLVRSFFWSSGVMTPIGVLPGFRNSGASDLNDDSIVVGSCNGGTAPYPDAIHAFVWRDGALRDLNSMVPSNTSLVFQYARAINSTGQIACEAFDSTTGEIVAALLTPIPPQPGDTNCDWLVNIDDLTAVITAWGTSPPDVPFSGSPDVNDDGTVNIDDLVRVITHWSSP